MYTKGFWIIFPSYRNFGIQLSKVPHIMANIVNQELRDEALKCTKTRFGHQLNGTFRYLKTSQELRMLSSVTLDCQVTKIVMNSGSQLSEL